MHLIPEPPQELKAPLLSVLKRCLDGGEVAPPWIAVDDGTPAWSNEAARRPPEERARAVVLAHAEGTLARAHQLGLGGALWLPPSTPALREALRAAASSRTSPAPCLDLGLHDLTTSPPRDLFAVTVANRGFWQWQLGDGRLAAALVALAEALGCLPTVFSWPALLVGDIEAAAITTAWNELRRQRSQLPQDPLLVVRLRPELCHEPGGLVPAASAALTVAEEKGDDTARHQSEGAIAVPVFSLPDGAQVGSWQCCSLPPALSSGWAAMPLTRTPRGYRWRLLREDGRVETVDEVCSTAALGELSSPVVRVPGWISNGLRPGSPAGLLVERLAAACARSGAVLWVSNVDDTALRMLLGLRMRVWIDGPAAPRE